MRDYYINNNATRILKEKKKNSCIEFHFHQKNLYNPILLVLKTVLLGRRPLPHNASDVLNIDSYSTESLLKWKDRYS
jgi:hypothetical protein